ncbi:MAG: hypothetical protein H0V73_01660 [Chloroflexi bacterium]|nr:hypothetical protein [Chloroflexota bacterium]
MAKLLKVLADKPVNLVAVGGSDLEFGGEMAIVVPDGDETGVRDYLRDKGYPDARIVDKDDPESGLTVCEVLDEPGKLHECLTGISSANLDRGRVIRDMLVGPSFLDKDGVRKVPVQIYSELAPWRIPRAQESAS